MGRIKDRREDEDIQAEFEQLINKEKKGIMKEFIVKKWAGLLIITLLLIEVGQTSYNFYNDYKRCKMWISGTEDTAMCAVKMPYLRYKYHYHGIFKIGTDYPEIPPSYGPPRQHPGDASQPERTSDGQRN